MCGIAGFAGAGERDDLERMAGMLAHRGPDAEAFWSEPDGSVQLAHRRLAVVDLDGGSQPMWTSDERLGVVFNGEIYNHAELREQLEALGHGFRTGHSDTEVLLHAYRQWGESFVTRLDGMWAFALYDRLARSILLSRDRFGEKPLYWTRARGLFAFASEASALLAHTEVSAGIDPAALRKYFAYGYVPAPHSIYHGMYKLPAGHNLRVTLPGGEPQLKNYWEFVLQPDAAPPGGPAAWQEELRERLVGSVARRLEADVPVGIFLSGGIDSAGITAAAALQAKPGSLHTFSMGFDEPSFDESAAASRVAQLFGTEHHPYLFTAEHAAEVWPELANKLDEPFGDASLLPTYVLCAAARRRVTVALGGDGADELFAGYDPFRALRWAEIYARYVPRPVHRAVSLLAAKLPISHSNLSLGFKIKRMLAGLDGAPSLWNPLWLAPLAPREVAELLEEPVTAEELYSEAIDAWDSAAGLSVVDRTLQFYTRMYLQNDILTKVDRASMLHGLEVRSPYLDVQVVDLVRRLPASAKLRGGETKWLLKRALAPWLPADVRLRPKKGFGVPVGRWLQESRAPFDAPPGGEFQAGRLAEHRAGRADHRLYLYADWALARFAGADPPRTPGPPE